MPRLSQSSVARHERRTAGPDRARPNIRGVLSDGCAKIVSSVRDLSPVPGRDRGHSAAQHAGAGAAGQEHGLFPYPAGRATQNAGHGPVDGSGGQLCAGCHAGAGYCGTADPQPGARAIPGIGRLAPVRVPGSCLCGARQAAHSDLPCAIALTLLRGNLQQAFANLCRWHPGKLPSRRRPAATAAAGSPRLCRGDWGSRRGRCHDCRRGCTVADAAD